VGEDVNISLAPGQELAVEPDEAIAIMIGGGIDHATLLLGGLIAEWRLWTLAWDIRYVCVRHRCGEPL
jgi:hypothetical protein